MDRSTFVRAPIPVSAPQGQGIASAAIEFGYPNRAARPNTIARRAAKPAWQSPPQLTMPTLPLRTDGNLHADAVREILHHHPARPAGACGLLSG